MIEEAPLQIYSSALLFSPDQGLVRRQFWEKEKPGWVARGPILEADWSPYVQTLTGHGDPVEAVAWSPDGRHIASGSFDSTLKISEAATGLELQTLDVGAAVQNISFDDDFRHIVIDVGRFRVENPSLPQTPNVGSTRGPVRTGFGVSADGDRITRAGTNIASLPLEYRATASAVASASLAWGCRSGRVYIIQFAS